MSKNPHFKGGRDALEKTQDFFRQITAGPHRYHRIFKEGEIALAHLLVREESWDSFFFTNITTVICDFLPENPKAIHWMLQQLKICPLLFQRIRSLISIPIIMGYWNILNRPISL